MTLQERPFCLCIAGPNGSGKSTLTKILRERFSITNWIDPDVVAAEIRQSKEPEHKALSDQQASRLAFRTARNRRVDFAAELQDFGFETVFSHFSNLDFLIHLIDIGYVVHLYFVCTEDYRINIGRVRNRVAQGGHDVDDLAIQNRYFRSVKLLEDAVHSVDRIVLFDNSDIGFSGGQALCEIVNDEVWRRSLQTRIEIVPAPYIPKWITEFLQRAYDRVARLEIKSVSPLPNPEERLALYRLDGRAGMMQHLKRHRMV